MPLEAYLKDLYDHRGTGSNVAETSFYPALSTLLNEIGGRLKPKRSEERRVGKEC